MTGTTGAGPRNEPGWIAQFRSALWSAGYQTAKVSEVLGAEREHLQPDPAQALLLKRQLPAGSPLSTLIRLFVLGLSAGENEVADALAPLSLEHAQALGVIQKASDSTIQGAVRITPFREFLFACSRVPDLEAIERDHVMGVTRSSINLANLTVRLPVELALDLGCGCGFQSLFASRHATKVIAVDINPLALRFTEFNARLNGVDNIECREGDYLEPVARELFDLIVSNPPFVISPDSRFLYRDSGMRGDELSRRIVRDVAGALQNDGMATVMVSWGRKIGDEWDATPRRWVEGTNCDSLILHQATQPALAHSASWHQPLATRDLLAYDEGMQRWIDYIVGLGFDAIAYGVVVLRRRPAPNWIRSEELPEPEAAPAGEQLLSMIAAQDLLTGLPDRRALLDQRFALVETHRLEQTLKCTNGSYSVERAVLELTEGLAFRANVDAYNAYLLTRMDGTRTLREGIAEAAQAAPKPDMEPDEIETAALRSVRRMLELGFIHKVNVK